jgi:hypothetical protein
MPPAGVTLPSMPVTHHAAPPERPVAAGHGHGHAHGSLPAASRHARRIMTAVLAPAGLATIIAIIALWPGRVQLPAQPGGQGGARAQGTVTSVREESCPPPAPGTEQPEGWVQRCGSATVRVTDGPGAGRNATVDLPQGPGAAELHVDDHVVLLYFPDAVPGGKWRQVGADLTGDGAFESAAFRVAGGDQPTSGLGEFVCAEAELLDLAGQFGGQRSVAEGQPCLVGKVGQEMVLCATQRVAGRHPHRDAAQSFPTVDHGHVETGGSRVADAGRRPDR